MIKPADSPVEFEVSIGNGKKRTCTCTHVFLHVHVYGIYFVCFDVLSTCMDKLNHKELNVFLQAHVQLR